VIAIAAAAAIVGDNLGFWLIGRHGGRALIAKSPLLERRVQRALPRAEALIERYGGRTVFLGRFIALLRETIAWIAGFAGMSWPRFLFWNASGGVVWASAVGLGAYFGGKAIADTASRLGLYLGVAAVIVIFLIKAAPRLAGRLR